MGTGNVFTLGPGLEPLADNGGPTRTHALTPGSPALNAGDSTVAGIPSNDQRGIGFSRTAGQIDIGAFERQVLPAVDTIVDESDGDFSSGDFSLREAIEQSNNSGFLDTIEFDPALFSSPRTIDLTLGELSITSSELAIIGPGEDLLTIDADASSRIFFVDSSSDVQLSEMTLTGGRTTGDGGAVRTEGSLTLNSVTLDDNFAEDDGGALSVATGATAIIDNSTFSNNTADSVGETNVGGAIVNSGSLTVRNSTLNDNEAQSGGAIWRQAELHVSNSTVSGNYASSSGGAVRISGSSSDATFLHATITNNSVPATGTAGGISKSQAASIAHLTNTIVAGNLKDTADDDLVGSGFTGDHNLTGTGASVAGVGNVANTLPMVDSLSNNGGSTATHALLSGSPAIDAGLSTNESNLVTHFRLDEPLGNSTITDGVYGNLGIVSGATLGVHGVPQNSGTAAQFDGTDDFIELQNNLSIGTGSHTLEVWVKIPSTITTSTGRVGSLLGNFDSSTSNDKANWEVHSNGEVRIYWEDFGGTTVNLFGSTDLRDDQWHHLAFVRDTATDEMRAYIDGNPETLSGTNSAGSDLNFATLHRIGNDRRSGGLPFQGTIDELAIHDRALTAAEIAERVFLPLRTVADQRNAPFARSFGSQVDIGAFESQTFSLVVDTLDDEVDGDFSAGELEPSGSLTRGTESRNGHDYLR